jgi:hypothetical protein
MFIWTKKALHFLHTNVLIKLHTINKPIYSYKILHMQYFIFGCKS